MRSLWSGSISFGLVNIPIKLYSAIQPGSIDLDMLDRKDHSNILFKRVNEKTGKEVEWENIVKGYKVDGRYVILTDEDFEKASPEKTKTIDITEFVKLDEVPAIYYDAAYYIEPEKNGGKAYILLRDSLIKARKAAIGSFVLRNKENLCLISASEKILVLHKLRYAHEVRSTEDVKVPQSKVSAAEINMAIKLIDQLSGKFDITDFKDSYTETLLKFINAKAKGRKFTAPKMRVVHSGPKDLMSELKASLSQAKRKAS
ncbi:Ku protein [Parafilimonas sp.]|uniref:non-homologous end joining protein Ku n=1 Tax=Parafilimonas sp. TaxID=1969739 RepID=UPI0039E273EF